jgi:hypothetical protein
MDLRVQIKETKTMRKLLFVLAAVIAVQSLAVAGITTYTGAGSQASWEAALSGPEYTINWDDVGVTSGTIIAGDRYAGMPAGPTLSVDGSSQLYVGSPSAGFFGGDFVPVSGSDVFAPDNSGSPKGVLTINFDQPVYALGAWFLDVEGDYATTGIKIGDTLYAFGGSQGDNSQSFLGIISDTSFKTAEIYMAMGSTSDGVGIDNVMYAVPLPASFVLGVFAMGLAGRKLRKLV